MDDNKSIQLKPENNSQALFAVQNTGGKLASLPDPEIFKAQLERSIAYREMIAGHIRTTFIKWTHYYKYHFFRDCKVYHCEDKYHVSPKWEITAEGAKKLTADFMLFPDYKTDEDTMRTFRNPQGLICLICFLYTIDSKFFASGRGNSKVGPYNDENKATKMAQKSALIDALKSSGLLSDFENTIADKEINGPTVISRMPVTNPSVKNNWCNDCPAPGPYHSKVCPNFQSPKPIEGQVI